MSLPKQNYQGFKQAFKQTCSEFNLEGKSQFIVLYGESDFLIERCLEKLKILWRKQHKSSPVSYFNGTELTPDQLMASWEQAGFFGSQELNILRRLDLLKGVEKVFGEIAGRTPKNTIIATYNKGRIPAALKKTMDQKKARYVYCLAPKSWEIAGAMQEFEASFGLKLDGPARRYFMSMVGSDMADIFNELRTLQLVYKGEQRSLGMADVVPYLPRIKDDHVFELTEMLVDNQHIQAQNTLSHLLQSGQSALGILSILARHCRNTGIIKQAIADGEDVFKLSRDLRLPAPVLKKYIKYAEKLTFAKIEVALQRCFQIDLYLKSSRINPEMMLSNLIMEL